MTATSAPHRIHFNRIAGHATYRGIRVHSESPIYAILRVLADRGFRGPADFIDERGTWCMSSPDIRASARRYRPTGAEAAEKRAEREGKEAAA